jgi:SWI/SNF-related matrix-associated actin-dependent regulator of chromatin subfamily D
MPNIHAQQRNAALEHQLAQRRSRKPNDRNMPEGVEDLVIGEGVKQYKDLRDVERKLDYTMMRKRLDIQDSIHRNVKRHKTMRIWISNTADNQPWQAKGLDENAFDFTTGEDGTYRVKIEGRILEDDSDETALLNDSEDGSDDEDEAKENDTMDNKQAKSPQKRLSHFFKSISVEFEKAKGMPTEAMTQIEWKKQAGAADFDCLEFERKGDENLNVTINLVRDEVPERFRLSQALSQTLDAEEADRAEVVMGIWEYVKASNLQEDEEKRSVRCDDRLRQVSCSQFLCGSQSHLLITPRSLVQTLSSFHRSQNG